MADHSPLAGMIFNIMRFSVHDGPGIRTTLFLKGCSLRCAWCHNPESISPHPDLLLRHELCLGCGACVTVCPQGAITMTAGAPVTARAECAACGRCATVCPADARLLMGRTMTVAEVMEQLLADRVFYDQSGGGVSFSGGEPTRQPAFLLALLQASKREGLHTVIDTCGDAPWEVFAQIAPLTDLFLFDLKMIDAAKHRRWTGTGNGRILENLRRLDAGGWPVNLRLPVIPGVNDSAEDIARMEELLAQLHHVTTLHLLPFHRAGMEKYPRLGRRHLLPESAPPSADQLLQLQERFGRHITTITIGG